MSYCYDANGNMTKRGADALVWTSYNMPSRIAQGGNSTQFFYGAGRARYKEVTTTASGGALPAGTETTISIGGIFDKVTKPSGVVEYRHSVVGGRGTVAFVTVRNSGGGDTRYLHRDHLNSLDTITDETGSLVLRLSFDAFGKRRNPTAWSGALTASDWTTIAATTHRGFTFHEALDNVGLIHMNGRVYDPLLGRFLSADPFVQSPMNAQSLNAYSYVENNPLSYVDPSGFFLKSFFKKVGRFVKSVVREIIVDAVLDVVSLACGPAAPACYYAGRVALTRTAVYSFGGGGGGGQFPGSSGGGSSSSGPTWGQPSTGPEPTFGTGPPSIPGIPSGAVLSVNQEQRGEATIRGLTGWESFWLFNPFGQGLASIADPIALFRSDGINPISGGYVEEWRAREAVVQSLAMFVTSETAPLRGVQSWLSGLGRGGARGMNHLGGFFNRTTNAAGADVWVSEGLIHQSDFVHIVQSGTMKGNQVNILSGVHGNITGEMPADLSLFLNDITAFGKMPGVTVHDISKMTPTELSSMLNSEGTIIGAFCNSRLCLAPYR